MTYFLLTYDRDSRSLDLAPYADGQAAQSAYAALELRLMDEARYEVVLLSAESEDEIRTTHSRYFSDDLIPA
ncbi:MAG: hypothetical protein JWL76_2285 [Thermoleophilia bacterium]|nr:hypothetical protein [Thermoleophilia bacterium]